MALSARRDGRAFVLPQAVGRRGRARAATRSCHPARSLLDVCAHLAGARRCCRGAARACAAANATIACRSRRRARPGAREARARDRRAGRALAADASARPARASRCSRSGCPALLPPLTEDEALEVAAIASLAGRFDPRRAGRARRFARRITRRARVALVGGGSDPRPGEISLAHHGVLFLDELPEWDRRVLEVLREPLESGVDPHLARGAAEHVSRAVPARRRDESLSLRLARRSRAAAAAARRTRSRAIAAASPGPLLDRIDLTRRRAGASGRVACAAAVLTVPTRDRRIAQPCRAGASSTAGQAVDDQRAAGCARRGYALRTDP